MPLFVRLLIAAILVLLIDLYFFQAVLTVMKGSSAARRSVVSWIYWSLTGFSMLVIFSPVLVDVGSLPKFIRIYFLAFVVMLLISKIVGVLILLVDDLVRLFRFAGNKITGSAPADGSEGISRLRFMSYLALGFAALPFVSFLYGMVRGAFNYQVHRLKVTLPDLPASFNGLRIVQISDIHSGSFLSGKPLEEAVKIVMEQKPDVVFFTGDLVNDRAVEVEPYLHILAGITAPLGVYSTLGNHDYGDYTSWPDAVAKSANLQKLKSHHAAMGWRLLMNEHVVLRRGQDEIAVLGIENWGGNLNFPKYGDMRAAYQGAEKYPVKLLLSHDPSHWSKQVLTEYPDIDITFSGHTHGFQFGIEIPGLKWSPSQYVYKEWAGLYSQGKQHVYVNRGLGFLGYPGRVGILPEITVMELYNT